MKKSKDFSIEKILLIIFLIASIIYLWNKNNTSFSQNAEYKVLKRDTNENYSGIGQEIVKNKDGYYTTFTTEEKNRKTYIEYKQNGDSSWANNKYWNGIMADTGCGITTLSIILSGYNKNYTPEELRKKYYPLLNYENLSNELSNTYGIENEGFYYDSIHLSQNKIEEHLKSNRPLIICVWNKPHENRWTTDSHYMALLATDGNGMVYVSNPNGLSDSIKSSGWYEFNEVIPYIAKILYIKKY